MKEKIEESSIEPKPFHFWKTFAYLFVAIFIFFIIFIGTYEEDFWSAFFGVVIASFFLAIIFTYLATYLVKWWKDYKSTGKLLTSVPEKIETEEDLMAFIVEKIKEGNDDNAISQSLVEKGVDKNDAEQLVKLTRQKTTEIAESQQFTSDLIFPALIGGIIAAIVCGILWSWIAISMDAEIGYMAIGVGFITGYAVLFFSKRKRGFPLQVIASISSIFGIIVGKYFIFMSLGKKFITEQYGVEAASQVPSLSGETIKLFMESFKDMVSGYDALWIILAVITAWYIPKGIGLKLPRHK